MPQRATRSAKPTGICEGGTMVVKMKGQVKLNILLTLFSNAFYDTTIYVGTRLVD